MTSGMNAVESQNLLPRPGVVASLRSGFDTIASNIGLILFPVGVDLLLWLGPHVRIKQILQLISDQMLRNPSLDLYADEQGKQALVSYFQTAAERINLLSFLRTFPVGVSSLMSGSLPVIVPGGEPTFLEITSFGGVLGWWVVISILGLVLGTMYYLAVAQVSVDKKMLWGKVLTNWPRASLQVLFVSLILGALIISISIPSGCFIYSFGLSGIPLGQIALFLYIGFIVWMFFPLVFCSHGIILYQQKMLASLWNSIRLTRSLMPMSGLLLMSIFLLSQGLDIVWRWPAEDSWLVLIGVAGHGFITTALLAATFIYYRDGTEWLQQNIKRLPQV
jgi:hypothetical protein